MSPADCAAKIAAGRLGKFRPALLLLSVGGLLTGCATGLELERARLPVPEERATEPAGTSSSSVAPDLASGPLALTAEEAALMALENNRALRVQRYEPLQRRELERVERGRFDPVVSLEALERRSRTELRDRLEEVGDEESTRVDAEMTVQTPWGGRWGLEAGVDRMSRDPVERYATRLGVHATQPLLRGAGRAATVAELRKARLESRWSEYEVRAVAESLMAQVDAAYWALGLARQRLQMVEESQRLAERQLEETRQRIRVGDTSASEQAAAEAEVALRREARIDAESRVAVLQARLWRLIQPDRLRGAEAGRLVAEPGPPFEPELEPLESHLQSALRTRPDLNQARLRVERGDVELVQTASGTLPRMDLFVRLGKTGYADALGSSAADLDGEGYEAVAGIGVEWPVGNRVAQARQRRAEWAREQAEESLRHMKDLVREDVHVAYVEAVRAREQVEATAVTRAWREETLRAETAKFAAGESTALLVARAQRDLLAAQVAEAEAAVQHRQARTELYRLDGSLLQRRGIAAPGRLEPAAR